MIVYSRGSVVYSKNTLIVALLVVSILAIIVLFSEGKAIYAFVILGILAIIGGLTQYVLYRQIKHTPVSEISSLAVGWAAVSGTVKLIDGDTFVVEDETGEIEVNSYGAVFHFPDKKGSASRPSTGDSVYVLGNVSIKEGALSEEHEDMLVLSKGDSDSFFCISRESRESVLKEFLVRALGPVIVGSLFFLVGVMMVLRSLNMIS